MAIKSEEILATGRRKCAVARVRLQPGTGKIEINGKAMAEYFPSEALCGYVNQVLKVTETEGKVDIRANLDGGGMTGQAGALRHGVARALVKMNEDVKAVLKAAGMLTRDARVKERKKPALNVSRTNRSDSKSRTAAQVVRFFRYIPSGQSFSGTVPGGGRGQVCVLGDGARERSPEKQEA